jgi:pimeloyl-ACP methyl ester carboxylesterase
MAFTGALWAAPDDLQRHGIIGLIIGPGTPPAVERVVAGAAGEAAGFQPGDVIRSVDGVAVATQDQFVRAIARHLGGQSVTVAISRGGSEQIKTAVLKPRPLETSPFAEVLYRSVTVRGARRRAIVTRPPSGGRLPAVLLMPGLGCYSVDNLDRQSGYGRIIGALEQKGFATMRVEKTGEGDSDGPECSDLSATPDLEAEGYLAGLRALKDYDFVDPSKVFVFAHSMGPVVGSLAVSLEPVRGFIAVETVGTSWFEYDLERLRVQAALSGKPPDEVDREVRAYTGCSFRFYLEKVKPEDLLKTPACRDMFAPFGSVPYTYMQGVAEISLGAQWKQADFPVLVIYGTSSPVTTARQSHYLVDLINRWHPGRATYAEVPGMGHDFNRYASPEEYHRHPGSSQEFHTGLLEIVLPWLDRLAS